MISGTVVLEDTTIVFNESEDMTITFTVSDIVMVDGKLRENRETLTVPMHKFFKALSIAVHADGMPDYNVDYADAESIMGVIRWIP